MLNSIKKGKAGEREFCKWLKDNLNLSFSPERNLEQTRSGGYDVLVGPFIFEVKRVETLTKKRWWLQVLKAKEKFKDLEELKNFIPVVAYRQNRKKWHFLIPMQFLVDCEKERFLELEEIDFIFWAKSTFRRYNK